MGNVFISYSHDSQEHRDNVLALSERLRADGITTLLDQYVNGTPPEKWPRWMLNQLDDAQFVLVVCTETYYRRFRGHETPGKGKGVDWEGMLITQEIYDSRSTTIKFIPVLFAANDEKFIPEPLRGGTHYSLTSESSYQSLYDFLLGQAGVEPGIVGKPKLKSRQKGTALTFGENATALTVKADISRILKYAPAELIGREDELKRLNDAWAKTQAHDPKRQHVLTFVALGGEGKTSLVAKWAAELAGQDWPGCDAAFAWSFYSQGTREQLAASSDLFLKEALTFFGDDADKAFAASPAGAFEKGQRLARIVGQRRSLLILDGLEPLQYPTEAKAFKPGELKDQGVAKLLKDLASNSRGLCIVTTRIEVPDLNAFKGGAVIETHLKRLPRAAGVALLKSLGVHGSERRHIPLKDGDAQSEKVNEYEKLVEDVKGHALTLTLLGGFLKRAFHGDIRQRDRVKFEKADEKMDGGHAFRTMAAYEQWLLRDGGDEGRREVAVLRLMGLFDRPADAGCLAALLQPPVISGLTEPLVGLAEDDWEFCLSGLEAAKLLTVNRDDSANRKSAIQNLKSLDAHPHLREYFARQVRTQQPDAWRAAHRRLYEHLCASTHEGDAPTLEDLQPLYQAVAHGCQAEMQQEACHETYLARIKLKDKNYSTEKLGSFGSDLAAVACFFEAPWSLVSHNLTEADQGWLMNLAALRLRALGRLTEALDPMRAGLEMAIKQDNWKSAAARAYNLSELELTIGRVAEAAKDAERSVAYADRSSYIGWKVVSRTASPAILHQSGRLTEAEARYCEAEQMQAEREPEYPLLYSWQGFAYCDLLLDVPERAAWQAMLGLNTVSLKLDALAAVYERVERTLSWAEKDEKDILSAALDHLTLSRVILYGSILQNTGIGNRKLDIELAVDGLRRAGRQDYLPRSLLTRAWLRFLTGKPTGSESAQEDLDEAWEIAERGPMKLHMADIHLYRARLFGSGVLRLGSGEKYPWESPAADLAAAEKLITTCGYHRRDEELADAKLAILGK